MEIKKVVRKPNNFTEKEWIRIKKYVLQTTGQIIYSEEELKSLGREATNLQLLGAKLDGFPMDKDEQEEYIQRKKQRTKKERANTSQIEKELKNRNKWKSMHILS